MGRSNLEASLGEIESLAVAWAETNREALSRIREARDELAGPCNLLAFVHVPKTAGGTVINMLAAAYSRAALNDAGNYINGPDKSILKLRRVGTRWRNWQRRGGRLVAGHVPYGVYRQYMPRGTRYMTFFREPVDRVVTHYYNHVRLRDGQSATPKPGDPRIRTATIEEAFEIGVPMLSNLSTRFLCGHPSAMESLPDSALEDAKANLRDFALVGLQERFEESIVLLQRSLDLPLTSYVNRHVSVERPLVEDLPEEERQLIVEHNRLDLELYAFAEGLFEEAVASTDDVFAHDVERLQVICEDANEEALRRAREMLDRELPLGASKPKAELFATAQRTGVPAGALKNVSKVGVLKHGSDGVKIWTRTESDQSDGRQ
jgi:hypothetical protein